MSEVPKHQTLEDLMKELLDIGDTDSMIKYCNIQQNLRYEEMYKILEKMLDNQDS